MSYTGSKNIQAGLQVTYYGMVGNLGLVILKLYFGLTGKSFALVADGIHSLSDFLSDIIVILGLKWGSKEADEDHPFGHGRIETLSSMIIGIILIVIGFGIVHQSLSTIYHRTTTVPTVSILYVAFISIVIKEIMFRYTLAVGKKLKSYALIGNAWHHRSDALSSVAVLIGAGLAYFKPEWVLADIFAALFVMYFVVKVGASLVWQSIKEFTDTAPGVDTVEKISEISQNIVGVINAHDIRTRYSAAQILAEVHIVVDSELTVREGHRIAKEVELTLIESIDDLIKVIVHVDPSED